MAPALDGYMAGSGRYGDQGQEMDAPVGGFEDMPEPVVFPHAGHTPENHRDEGRQMGQDEHRKRPSKRLGRRKTVDSLALSSPHVLVHH